MIRDVRIFLASLTKVNTEIAFYIFGAIDQGNGLPDRVFPPDREWDLGAQMVEAGRALQERARERRTAVEERSPVRETSYEQEELGERP